MSKYCLDTNIISYITGNYKDWSDYNTAKKNIISHLDKYQANEIVLTDITAVELKEWMKSYYEKASQKDYIWLQNLTESQKAKLRQFRKQNKLLQELQIYNLNQDAFYEYKNIVSYMKATPRSDHSDYLIAAICIVNDFILVTHNIKDFKGIKSLVIEDWFIK